MFTSLKRKRKEEQERGKALSIDYLELHLLLQMHSLVILKVTDDPPHSRNQGYPLALGEQCHQE